tara:strand:+ start:1511 stop:1906 length:396 start_codon:yes stop_codon:yes gene_type:complete
MTKSTNTTAAVAVISKQDVIFNKSIAKIKTGNETVDAICSKLVTMIRSEEIEMIATDEGFAGVYKQKEIKISKVVKGKTSRYLLDIMGLEIGGAFASKSYNLSKSQNSVSVKSVKVFEASAVTSAALLFEM